VNEYRKSHQQICDHRCQHQPRLISRVKTPKSKYKNGKQKIFSEEKMNITMSEVGIDDQDRSMRKFTPLEEG
jgi:hypothetical protein